MTPEGRARAISAELDRWWAEDVEAHPWPEDEAGVIQNYMVMTDPDDIEGMNRLKDDLAEADATYAKAYEAANADRNARWEAHRAEFVLELDGG